MKKLSFLLSLCLLLANLGFSQELLDTYSSSFLMDQNFEIKVRVTENQKYIVQIQLKSLDALRDDVGFELGQKELSQLLDDIKSSKIQYLEWKETAISNNVNSLEREIKNKRRWFNTYFISSGDKYLSYSHWPRHVFTIKESSGEVNYRLIIFTGKQQASTNQFITTDGGMLVFSNETEIDLFIEKLNPVDVELFASEMIRKKTLFRE